MASSNMSYLQSDPKLSNRVRGHGIPDQAIRDRAEEMKKGKAGLTEDQWLLSAAEELCEITEALRRFGAEVKWR